LRSLLHHVSVQVDCPSYDCEYSQNHRRYDDSNFHIGIHYSLSCCLQLKCRLAGFDTRPAPFEGAVLT